jgi:feruloyl esterase
LNDAARSQPGTQALLIQRATLVFLLFTALTPLAGWGEACVQLLNTGSPQVSITAAETISTGAFLPSGGSRLTGLPGFCRVVARLRPTSDSDIGIEVWLPAVEKWNGKYLAVGSGGWGGSIAYTAMADALRRGYATSATDDGHTGSSAGFLMGHPEKFVDFAYRAEHEMTVEAKHLVRTFYGRDPRYSYWDGCSGGGREGLLQATRFPDAFDGIIAGDPADVRRNSWALWLANKTFKDPADRIPPDKYAMIHRAALDACDENDGLKDGLLESPDTCTVDFSKLACHGKDAPDCLTDRQVHTAQTIISPATDREGNVVFPRLEPGTELRWARLAGGPEPADLFLDEFRYVVYRDPHWDWRTFDLTRDAAKANAADRGVDALDPRLEAFRKRGGKLLLYHGWADQQVAPASTINFYNSVLAVTADPSRPPGWIRLFMVPGMAHCTGGEGPDDFNKIQVLERWVEQGEIPDRIIASHHNAGKVDRTRPLCAYPSVAHYDGKGSIDDAASFSCSPPSARIP